MKKVTEVADLLKLAPCKYRYGEIVGNRVVISITAYHQLSGIMLDIYPDGFFYDITYVDCETKNICTTPQIAFDK